MSGAILGIFKAGKRRTPKVKVFFQKAYGEFIDGAFSDSPTQERKIYAAIYDYYRQKPSSSYAKLLKLRKECQRTNDIYAVTVFLGLCCDDMGIYEDAISHYQAALAIRNNSTVFSNMGLCFQHIGKFEEAEDAYRNALQVDSKNTYALNNLSVLYFRRGDYETSLKLSKDVLEMDAKMVQALSNAALCSALLGKQSNYESYYRLAVSNGYDGRKIRNYLAQMDVTPPAVNNKQ